MYSASSNELGEKNVFLPSAMLNVGLPAAASAYSPLPVYSLLAWLMLTAILAEPLAWSS